MSKAIQYIVALSTFLSVLCGKLIFNKRHLLRYRAQHHQSYPSLTIIIPARNEAHRLGRLLHSLQMQSIKANIIVMDDGSTDNTRHIAECYGAIVKSVEDDTDGSWYGKSHACYQGASYVTTSLVMFIDADVELTSIKSIETLLQAYHLQSNHGLLSVQPFHHTKQLYEGFSAIFNLMTVVGMNIFSTLARGQSTTTAFGPLTLTHIDDYFQTGGHLNARTHIIEGFALGQAYSTHRLPVHLYEGKDFVQFRMYQEGFKSLLEGWTKHFAVGASQTDTRVMLGVITWLLGSIITSSGLVVSLMTRSIATSKMFMLYLIYTIQFIKMHKRVGSFTLILLICHPILFIFFIMIFMNSWSKSRFTKTVEWKGRKYNI